MTSSSTAFGGRTLDSASVASGSTAMFNVSKKVAFPVFTYSTPVRTSPLASASSSAAKAESLTVGS